MLKIDSDYPNRLVDDGRPVVHAGWYLPHGLITGYWKSRDRRRDLFHYMKANGCNFVRCFATCGMALENQPWLVPYERSDRGRTLHATELGVPGRLYDLDRFNDSYFTEWRQIVADAGEFGVYLQIVLLDGAHTTLLHSRLDPSYGPWRDLGLHYDFLHANNSLQGVGFNSGQEYMASTVVREYHKRLVSKFVSEVSPGHEGIYEILNESDTSVASYPEWFRQVEGAARGAETREGRIWMPRHIEGHRSNAGHEIPAGGGLSDERAIRLYHDLAGKARNAVTIADDDSSTTSAPPDVMGDKTKICLVAGAIPDSMHFSATRLDGPVRNAIRQVGAHRRFLVAQGVDVRGMEPAEVPGAWVLAGNGRAVVFSLLGGRVTLPGAYQWNRSDGRMVAGDTMSFVEREMALARTGEPDTSPVPDDPRHLNLADGRFDLTCRWQVGEREGEAVAAPFREQTGAFSLGGDPRSATVFPTIKDGREVGSPHWWIELTWSTTAAVWVEVRQVSTGLVQTYHKPEGLHAAMNDHQTFAAEAP